MDFDAEFKRIEKEARQIQRIATWTFVTGVIVSLVLSGGAIYVAIHFIRKIW